jgi:hypothetical protein
MADKLQPCRQSLEHGRTDMKSNIARAAAMLGCLVGAGLITPAARVDAASPNYMQVLDTDHDGTIDLTEAKAAAGALFDRLDRDHDGTLDRRELRGRVGAKEFAAADSDHDGTVDRNEYLAIVEQRFNAANADNDGTLDAKEMRSSAGRALLSLLM